MQPPRRKRNGSRSRFQIAVQKLLANPEQIVFCLFVNGNAGPNTGMDKQEIAAAVEEIERIQKVQVLPWKGARQLVGQTDQFMPVRLMVGLSP
jgi:hypothetical protein